MLLTFFSPFPLLPLLLNLFFFVKCENNVEKMDPLLNLSVIYTITIGTMLNFTSGNNGQRLKIYRAKYEFN